MIFLKKLGRLSSEQLLSLMALCGGVAVLITVAVFLSGMTPLTPTQLKTTLNTVSKEASTAALVEYSAPNNYTWTAPEGVTSITLTLIGAGGGAGGSGIVGDGCGGAGGGAGGKILAQTVAVTPGTSYPISVGRGGGGGVFQMCQGAWPRSTAGGNTSFGTLVATGGAPGTWGSASGYGGGGAGGSPGCATIVKNCQISAQWCEIFRFCDENNCINRVIDSCRGGDTIWYMCGPAAGGSNGTLYGKGGSHNADCYSAGLPGQNGYISINYTAQFCADASGGGATGSFPNCTCNDPTRTFDAGTNSCIGLPPPTATIDVGAGNGVNRTVSSGASYTVTATYTPGSGDTLTASAINGNDQVTSVSCAGITPSNASCWTQPDAVKTYTFTPVAGTYTFYAAEKTAAYSTYNNYKSVTLTVVDQCVNGSGPAGACTSCNPGYIPSGGNCVLPSCPGGQINPPACTICAVGYHNNSANVCVPDTCSDPHAVPPLCNSCVSGYTMRGGVCVLIPPTVSLTVAQSRVRSGTPASLSWSVNGLSGDPTEQCAIASSPSGVFSRVMPAGTQPTWSSSNVATGPINGTTVFTLSCTGATPVSKTVTVIPEFQEI